MVPMPDQKFFFRFFNRGTLTLKKTKLKKNLNFLFFSVRVPPVEKSKKIIFENLVSFENSRRE